MEAVKFKNFTNVDFTWKWDGVPYTFKAGQEIYLPGDQALHFAKHLVDQEMNRLNVERGVHGTNKEVPTTNPERKQLEAQCFPTDEIITPLEALNRNEGKTAEIKEEEEFPDLKKKKKVTHKDDIV